MPVYIDGLEAMERHFLFQGERAHVMEEGGHEDAFETAGGKARGLPQLGGDEGRPLLVLGQLRAGQVHSVGQRKDEVAEVYGYVT